MRRILVTGAAGFIGSHLCEQLMKTGNRVVGIDNFDDYYPRLLKENNLLEAQKSQPFKLIESDVRNEANLVSVLRTYEIDTVVHLAARPGVRASFLDPKLYFGINIDGLLSVLESMKTAGVRRLVFASSSSVYGRSTHLPFREDEDDVTPVSPYGSSKRAGELLCQYFHHDFGFDIFCLRLFSVYGPRQRPDMAIYRFLTRIASNQPVQIFGDGSTARDFTFIDDAIRGICSAIEKLHGFAIVNIGSSQAVSLHKLLCDVEQVVGQRGRREYLPDAGDPPLTVAHLQRSTELLGYVPTVTLAEGIQRTFDWIKETTTNNVSSTPIT